MKIAIGIPTFNRGNVLLDTIRDALKQQPPADEIIVVDQSDWYPEGVQKKLDELSKIGAIRYFRQEVPNLPMARNRVLKETQSDIVIFIDDDVKLSTGFVAAHFVNYRDDTVWAVCGRVTERDIPVRSLTERSWLKTLDYKFFDAGWTHRVENFGTVKGGNHSVRRSNALSLGGYDEAYIGVALREETDLAFRIIQAGGTICFDPVANLHHLRAPAGGCRVSLWGDWTAGCSVLRFAMKHRKQLKWYFWTEIWHAYRLGVLNKSSIQYPMKIFVRSFDFLFQATGFILNIDNKKSCIK